MLEVRLIRKYFSNLGDKRIKLLICHGGLNSVMEAIYHGLPIIGLPIFHDHNTTAANIENFGIGKQMKWSEITEDTLNYTISYVLNNKQ